MLHATRLVLPLFWVFIPLSAVAAEPGSFTPDVRTFQSGGVEIAYLDAGVGEPVVLLQGFGGRLTQWKPMRRALLEAGYRLIEMDSRGHGQSEKPHDVPSYGAKMADDIVRLLDHLNIRRAHLIGYSMGGDIANKVRERYPDRLLSVVMGGVGRGVTKGWSTAEFDYLELAKSLERGEGLKVLFSVPDGFGRRPLTVEEKEAANRHFMEGQDQDALAAVIRAYGELEVSEESLRTNSVPTLLIVGEHDPEKSTVLPLKGLMKNARIVVIPGTDHLTAGGQPDFIRSVLDFMRSNPRVPR